MSDRKQALQELLAKVEAGGVETHCGIFPGFHAWLSAILKALIAEADT